MFKLGDIAFGDNVEIVETDATRASGHAGRAGVCYGLTTPSATGVDVIGDAVADAALNVHFEDGPAGDAWFAPELVRLVDRAAGSVATIGDQTFTKAADGEWVPETPPPMRARRRWFKRT